ncbi:DUF2125 domain-containing protein [Aurantimonas marianensis]|uniref:DUF2125 domain-containing protein n=1 Tax=Aurantimonas marianensis TaxID=2920428 RepID=A0A9X2H403_9HYPH|nr:DUF2125 domain-containing protein [Aurantimonas marianensis]MCP3053776.1 DUF2125 domain-containing protein [Aurantimonas marianensis]
MAASSGKTSGAGRAFVWVIGVALLLAGGLSGAWYYLADQLETQVTRVIAGARVQGAEIGCAGRSVFGYPFRLGVRCDAVTLEMPGDARGQGLRATAGALRTAAQIYRPNRVVAELDSPLLVDAQQMAPLDIRWQLTQASASFWTEGMDRFALVADQPVVALAQPAAGRLPLFEAGRFEAHARRRDGDLDIAVSSADGRVVAPDAPSLPVFDAAADLTLTGAADWLAGRIDGDTLGEALAGREGALRSLKLDFGEASAELSGDFAVAADGLVSGDFELAVADPQRIAALVGEAMPQFAPIAQSVASAIGFVARQENGRDIVALTLRDGNLSAGVIPLGQVPAIR